MRETANSRDHLRKTLAGDLITKLRRYEWLLPTLLAIVAATRVDPLAAPAVLLLLCYVPGCLIIRGCGLASHWDAAGRVMLAVAVSVAVTPVALNPIWHLTNSGWPLLGCIWLLLSLGGWVAGYAGRVAMNRDPDSRPAVNVRLFDHARTKIVFAAIAGLVAFAAIGTYWPTELRGYPVPALIHDFIKHHGVLFSLEQRPLPLGNPFFADGAAGPVYYYHFFYLIPATVRALSPGVSIELAFGIQAAVVGIGTAGMSYLIVKRFTDGDGPATLAALLTSAIGGLDILPVLALRMRVVTLDAWADPLVRIHNFFTQIVWTPQNVQGVLVTLVGVHLLSLKGWWKGWLLLGPVLAAGLIGSTVWVAAGVFPGLLLFVLIGVVALRSRPALALKRLLLSGAVALLMFVAALPSLRGYAEMSHRYGKGLTADWETHQSHALLGRLVRPGVIANLLDLPWVLVLEFGPLLLFPLLLPTRVWRQAWTDPGLRFLLIAAGVALVGFVSLRSDFAYNDFGHKILLLTMAAGVVMGACILTPQPRPCSPLNPLGWSLHGQSTQRPRRLLGSLIGVLLLLGLPVGLYQSPVAAVRRYCSSNGPLRVLAHPAALRAAREAEVGRFMRYGLPADAVIQAHWDKQRLHLPQIARKQIGVTVLEQDTMVFFPADAGRHRDALRAVAEVLEQPVPAPRCRDVLRAHGITHVLVGDIERARWQGLYRFADRRCFDCVFNSGSAAVYALR